MSVLMIAALGMTAVLVCILLLRLHPLLALLIGSLLLLILTPEKLRLENELAKSSIRVEAIHAGGLVAFKTSIDSGPKLLWPDDQLPIQNETIQFVSIAAPVSEVGETESAPTDAASSELYWYKMNGESRSIALQPGVRLIGKTQAVTSLQSRWSTLGSRLSEGLASTFKKLGLPVTMAAIVGACLLESGAATRIVAAIIAAVGANRTAPALTVSGFLLGVPVYFDNVFYLLLPLAKAVGRQRPEMYLTAVMAIIVGATMAHSLVPPTPGPLFVANELKVTIGTMMIGGSIVGSAAAAVGFGYGLLCSRWMQLTVPELTEQEQLKSQETSQRTLPLWLAALPIALPICCLGGSEIVRYYLSQHAGSLERFADWQWLAVFGDPVLVFIVAAIISILILGRSSSRSRIAQTISRGLADAGVIVLLTCAGGAFGAALKELHIAEALGNQFNSVASPWGILFTAFLLTAIIRAAQGSATVAMLTSSAIVAPAVMNIDLPFHPVYIALAIGCGSKPLPWMNDSGFWQVATMTGMTTSQTLKTFTAALTLMGLTGFAITIVGAWLLPLV